MEEERSSNKNVVNANIFDSSPYKDNHFIGCEILSQEEDSPGRRLRANTLQCNDILSQP